MHLRSENTLHALRRVFGAKMRMRRQGALGPGAWLTSAGKRRAEAILVIDVHVLEIAQYAAEAAGYGAHARESEVLVQVDGGLVRSHHGVELQPLRAACASESFTSSRPSPKPRALDATA